MANGDAADDPFMGVQIFLAFLSWHFSYDFDTDPTEEEILCPLSSIAFYNKIELAVQLFGYETRAVVIFRHVNG